MNNKSGYVLINGSILALAILGISLGSYFFLGKKFTNWGLIIFVGYASTVVSAFFSALFAEYCFNKSSERHGYVLVNILVLAFSILGISLGSNFFLAKKFTPWGLVLFVSYASAIVSTVFTLIFAYYHFRRRM